MLFPVHPRTRPLLAEAGLDESGTRVRLVDPVGYLDMLALQREAAVVVTDSGGIQEEACMLRTPCVTVRRNTERQITIEIGSNRLASANCDEILSGVSDALSCTAHLVAAGALGRLGCIARGGRPRARNHAARPLTPPTSWSEPASFGKIRAERSRPRS